MRNFANRKLWPKQPTQKWRYDDLVGLMVDKEMLIHWLIEEGLMAKERLCPMRDGETDELGKVGGSIPFVQMGMQKARKEQNTQGRDFDQERRLVLKKQNDIRRDS